VTAGGPSTFAASPTTRVPARVGKPIDLARNAVGGVDIFRGPPSAKIGCRWRDRQWRRRGEDNFHVVRTQRLQVKTQADALVMAASPRIIFRNSGWADED